MSYVVMEHTYDGGEILGVWPTAAEAARQARGMRDNGGITVERIEGDVDMGRVWVYWPGDGAWEFNAASYGVPPSARDAALKAELDAAS